MRNWKKLLLAVVPMTLALSFTAFAGQWNSDMNGWWYEENDGSYLKNGWHWLDGNNDGVEECYYFGKDGYLVKDLGYVDGYQVDENGAWIVNGKVQRRTAQVPAEGPAETPAVTDSTDPMAVFLAAQEKNNALDSLDMDADYVISMTAEGMSMTMGMDMNIKMKNVQDGNLQFIATGNIDLLGSQMPINMFYADGYYYMDSMGMKMKQAMPMNKALESVSSNMEVADIDTSMMSDLQMRREGDTTILSYTTDAASMNDYMKAVMGDSLNYTDGIQITYNIKSSSGEAYINKEGYYTGQKMYVDMDMTMIDTASGQTETIGYIMDVTATINNPGQPVDFAIPSTDGYEDVSAY